MGLAYPGQVIDVYSRSSVLSLVEPGENIISLDPGDSTGFACINLHQQYVATYGYDVLLNVLMDIRYNLPSDMVVERFVTAPNPFAKTQYAGKVCGAADMVGRIYDFPIHYQSPSDMKTMLPDLKALRRGGWSWCNSHECDALRHALYYLVTR